MSTRRPGGGLRRLGAWAKALPEPVVDASIAALCVIYVTFQAALDGRLSWWISALAVVNALPLLWRRRYPFAVTAIIGVGTTGRALVDALGDLPAAQLVATYTFAALSPPVKQLIAALGTIVGFSVSILVPADSALNIGRAGLLFGVAYALGAAARARRDRITLLEERARRLTEQQDAAAARERQRIAREMHDVLAHSMSLVAVQAEAGPVVVRSDPDKAEEVFDAIAATARDALGQLRRALGVLRDEPDSRAPQPGIEGLPELLAGAERAGLRVDFAEHGDRPPIPADVATAVYRLVQESLTNTLKHAEATTVVVRLDWRPGALDLTVRDDGRSPSARDRSPESGGHGLIGMRERVAALGGTLTTGKTSDGDAGFDVAAHLPVGEQPLD